MPKKRNERLIIFTRYPEPGKTKTRLIPLLGEQGAADLQRRMTEHLITKIRNLCPSRSLSIEIHYEGGDETRMQNWLGPEFVYHRQHPGNIGRRMRLAFDDVFQAGIEAAVMIGSDIPGITPDILREAFDNLGTHDLVFGPAGDGGYYLVGTNIASWSKSDPILFEDMPWGSAAVLSKTLETATQLGLSHILLEKLDDVDRPENLDVWYRETRSAPGTQNCSIPISVIIPALNEADNIRRTLLPLTRKDGVEVIVVDGGSHDGTADLAAALGAKVLTTLPSKAKQMNVGADAASGKILIFLHADTRLPDQFEDPIIKAVSQSGVSAGAFQLHIDSPAKGLRFIERVANWRARHLQAPYGDQAIFVTKTLFHELGGFAEMEIMEDFEFVRRLRRKGQILIVNASVTTSARRWLNLGIFNTWLLNQTILAGYYLGVPPQRLSCWYRRKKGKSAVE